MSAVYWANEAVARADSTDVLAVSALYTNRHGATQPRGGPTNAQCLSYERLA